MIQFCFCMYYLQPVWQLRAKLLFALPKRTKLSSKDGVFIESYIQIPLSERLIAQRSLLTLLI